eukprot:31562-Pelagococcus_subviridis.AAC.1
MRRSVLRERRSRARCNNINIHADVFRLHPTPRGALSSPRSCTTPASSPSSRARPRSPRPRSLSRPSRASPRTGTPPPPPARARRAASSPSRRTPAATRRTRPRRRRTASSPRSWRRLSPRTVYFARVLHVRAVDMMLPFRRDEPRLRAEPDLAHRDVEEVPRGVHARVEDAAVDVHVHDDVRAGLEDGGDGSFRRREFVVVRALHAAEVPHDALLRDLHRADRERRASVAEDDAAGVRRLPSPRGVRDRAVQHERAVAAAVAAAVVARLDRLDREHLGVAARQ